AAGPGPRRQPASARPRPRSATSNDHDDEEMAWRPRWLARFTLGLFTSSAAGLGNTADTGPASRWARLKPLRGWFTQYPGRRTHRTLPAGRLREPGARTPAGQRAPSRPGAASALSGCQLWRLLRGSLRYPGTGRAPTASR